MANLELFRELAAVLATREKKQIGILTDKGTVAAIYDPLFKTVTVCSWQQSSLQPKPEQAPLKNPMYYFGQRIVRFLKSD